MTKPIFSGGKLLSSLEKEKIPNNSEYYRLFPLPNEVGCDDGWIYEKKKNGQKGKKLRKWFKRLEPSYYNRGSFNYWPPKMKDLRLCEEKRWKAYLYYQKRLKPLNVIFEAVLKEAPFCCLRVIDGNEGWPETHWAEFEKTNNDGIYWNWVEKNKQPKKLPVKQQAGDAWFHREFRGAEIRRRFSLFDQLFNLALNEKYARRFYDRQYATHPKMNLVINGRNYLIGFESGRQFGVIAYPEDTIQEVVE